MQQSHVIEVSGQFAGAAVADQTGKLRFVAIDPRVEELDGSLWRTLPDVRRVVERLLTTGRLSAPLASDLG